MPNYSILTSPEKKFAQINGFNETKHLYKVPNNKGNSTPKDNQGGNKV